MSHTPTPEAEQPTPLYKAVVLHRADQTWARLEQLVSGLSEAQLTTVRDSQGWSIKDHLAHLTVWEQSLLALIQGRSRDEALGLDEGAYRTLDVDDINRIIYQRDQRRTLDDVLARSRRTHQELRAALDALTDADLLKPYSHYQPSDPPEQDGPVMAWVMGNTYGHYEDHIGWIQGLLQAQPSVDAPA